MSTFIQCAEWIADTREPKQPQRQREGISHFQMTSQCFKLPRDYSYSLILWNAAKLRMYSVAEFAKTALQFREKNEDSPLCVHVFHKTLNFIQGHFTLYLCSERRSCDVLVSHRRRVCISSLITHFNVGYSLNLRIVSWERQFYTAGISELSSWNFLVNHTLFFFQRSTPGWPQWWINMLPTNVSVTPLLRHNYYFLFYSHFPEPISNTESKIILPKPTLSHQQWPLGAW